MSLQSYCDEIEQGYGVIVQIKQERRPIYAGIGTFIRLAVTDPTTGKKTVSGETRDERTLRWWLNGIVHGMYLKKTEDHS